MKTDGLVKIVSGTVSNSELVKFIKDIKEMYRTDYLLIEKEKEVTSFYIRNENYQKIYKLIEPKE